MVITNEYLHRVRRARMTKAQAANRQRSDLKEIIIINKRELLI